MRLNVMYGDSHQHDKSGRNIRQIIGAAHFEIFGLKALLIAMIFLGGGFRLLYMYVTNIW